MSALNHHHATGHSFAHGCVWACVGMAVVVIGVAISLGGLA